MKTCWRFATPPSSSSSRRRGLQPDSPAHAIVRHIVTFGRVLREGGLEVGPGRIADSLRGLDHVDLGLRDDVYWTLRANFVTRRDEIDVFDRAFDAWFLRSALRPFELPALPRESQVVRREHLGARGDAYTDPAEESREQRGYSAEEILRSKDFAAMTPAELERVRELIAQLATDRPTRSSRRLRRHHRGRKLDLRLTIRESLGAGGDPFRRVFRTRARVQRKLVVICDVSGSMEAYARALLLFVHAARVSGKGV